MAKRSKNLDEPKKEKPSIPVVEEPQEAFFTEHYTLAGIEDERLAWISKNAWEARELFHIESVGVDCVQLGKFLNENPIFRIGIKTVELPISIDAQTVYLKEVDRYYIGLNRSKLRYPFRSSSDYRANFTIAHELGHILLGHLSLPDTQKDDALRQEQDTEADEFAGQFLMPERLLLRCTFRWPSKVAEHFKVSHTALWQRLNNLKCLDLLGDAEKEKRYTRCCDVCGNRIVLMSFARYCSICGNELTKNTWGILPFPYYGPESSRTKVMICPKCGANLYYVNTEECPSCGLPRRNSCVAGCLEEHKPSDRYCIRCGGPTMYFAEGFLTHWCHALYTGKMVEPYRAKFRPFHCDDIGF